MQQALQVFYDNDVNYIFSFSPESEHEDVLALMEEKSECTYFATFTPDLFFIPAMEIQFGTVSLNMRHSSL